MGDFKVVDKTGIWLSSVAAFPMIQPDGHRFLPRQPTKIDLDDWIKGQVEAKVLTVCDDPLSTDDEIPKNAKPGAAAPGSPGGKAK